MIGCGSQGGMPDIANIVVDGSRKEPGFVVASTFAIADGADVVVVVVCRECVCDGAYGMGVRRRHNGSLLFWMR